MPTLSDEQKQKYLSICGVRCPYCGSEDIRAKPSRSTKARLRKKSIATPATASGSTSTHWFVSKTWSKPKLLPLAADPTTLILQIERIESEYLSVGQT